MDTHGSSRTTITELLAKIQSGDDEAAYELWERFFYQLLSQCRLRLRTRGVSDEEDIVLSAMKSFYIGLRRGQFQEVNEADNLWRLLMTIVTRKISDSHQHHSRKKRSMSRTRSLEDLDFSSQESRALVDRELNPELAAECSEEVERLIAYLEHDDLKCVAVMKMEGYTNQEIAHQIQCSLTSVERKLRTIRAIWGQRA